MEEGVVQWIHYTLLPPLPPKHQFFLWSKSHRNVEGRMFGTRNHRDFASLQHRRGNQNDSESGVSFVRHGLSLRGFARRDSVNALNPVVIPDAWPAGYDQRMAVALRPGIPAVSVPDSPGGDAVW